MPGQPGPVYPPGQFSAWNRPSVRASWLGMNGNGDGSRESDAEPGYSVLATSDPSADATVTQAWAAMDDTGDWSPPPPARDVSAHTDGEGIPTVRRAGGRAAAAQRTAFEAATSSPDTRSRQLAPWESGNLPTGRAPTGRPPAGRPPMNGPAASPAGARGAPAAVRDPGSGPPATGRGGPRRGPGAARGAAGPRRQTGGSGRATGSAGSRSGGLAVPSHRALIGLLMAPVVIVILVVAVIVYLGSRPVAPVSSAAAPSRPAVTPTATLGPWKNITSQAVDAHPLTVQELYPARFSVGGNAGTRTVERANTKCTNAVIGSSLRAAVRKGGCTQVMRASYLSTNRKMMATIGVLNLVNVTAAEKAGKAAGATEFIRQLPGPHGPTHNLTKGTGLEEAEVKGHYLILIWTEFANLHAPSGKKQRKQLMSFSADLFRGTANLSLTSRMVTGKPLSP